ncbi:MAG: hypothetical protein ACTHU0_34255 [Kofleriaceae bacterium]
MTLQRSWKLELGRPDELSIGIALARVEDHLELVFESEAAAAPPALQLAMVQPGRYVELPPWHAPLRTLTLPWAMSPFDDLWLLVRAGARRYCLEVPYGICRASNHHGDGPQLGPPRSPPNLAPGDVVRSWQTIRIDAGRIDGWQLDITAASGRPGELDLELRRPEPGYPPQLAIAAARGSRTVELRRPAEWRAVVANRHLARIAFAPPAIGSRALTHLVVLGGERIELGLPTSLTDPDHKAAGPRPVRPA